MDPRLLNHSYSSFQTKHSCPRKMQLDKLRGKLKGVKENTDEEELTFDFGHLIGLGVQLQFQGLTKKQIYWEMFKYFKSDLLYTDEKRNKSFFLALIAISKFISSRENGYLKDYELVSFKDKPAVELGFRISFPDGYKFRGFVDVVLQHIITKQIVVIEVKSTSFDNLNGANYINSSQAIGYSIVLDHIVPDISSYDVIYIVYKTKKMEYQEFRFTKSPLQRASWIQDVIFDFEDITRYEKVGMYPMRGESCYSFFRDCKYLGVCTLNTAHLTVPYDAEKDEELTKKYDFELTLEDLIRTQIERSEL